LEQLNYFDLGKMLERGELSSSLAYRRQTLLAVAEIAKGAKSHTRSSKTRLKKFREMLDSEQNNEEIEVAGEILCEVVMLAMHAKGS
jgi:hypothetical protein